MVLLESQIKLKTGDQAPDFDLMGADDKRHNLSNYKKDEYQGLLVIFMCNHCPYVKAKIDAIREIYEKFNDKIAIVGINSNDPTNYPDDSFDNMKKLAKEKNIGIDYLVDDSQEIAKRYGAICTPDPFLFDKDHKLVFHGRIDNAMKPDDTATEKTMIDNIERLLAGNNIEKDFEPSIGCSIKWKET
jgi:peroxiredoxin